MHLIKLGNGHYSPMDEKDYDESKKIKVGDVIKGTKSRNWKFHKKAMALLNLGFENQEKFTTFNVYRKVITIRAGHYEMAEGNDKQMIPIADSLSYEKMSANNFDSFYEDALNVISKDLETAPEVVNEQIAGFY